MTTVYPAPMEFALDPSGIRDRVLAAAARLGLVVTHQNAREFTVIVPTWQDALAFGSACWPDAPKPGDRA